MTDTKRPVGRPSKYDPDTMLPMLLELGAQGASKLEMAVKIGISRETFNQWEDQFPEFSDTVKQAIALSQAWWEEKGRMATFGAYEGFNATSFIFNMKNRFKEDWRDKVETEHSGKVEGLAINIDLGEKND